MDIDEDRKKYLVLVILAGILFICIFIAIVIFIWSRPIGGTEDKQSTAEKSLGSYTNVSFSLEEQVKIYSSNISSLLTSNDIDGLYKILNEEYIKYSDFDKNKFKEYIGQKNVSGKNLNLKEYKDGKIGNNKVIKLILETDEQSNKVSIPVTVFETSPNIYTIAFDNFISYNSDEVSFEENGLRVTLYNQTLFSNEYKTNIKITNISNSVITLNKQKASEVFYINQGVESDKKVSTNILMGQALSLNSGESINYTISFLISEFTFDSIKKFKIKDVTNEDTNNTQNIEINLYNSK